MVALAAFQPGGAPTGAEEEIIVVARRLPTVSVWLSRNPAGKFVCGMSHSSGSRGMDERLCKAAAACMKNGNAEPTPMRTCIETRKPKLFEEFKRGLRSGA